MTTPVLGVAGSQALWYLTRGSGVVALVLLTASVVLGILGAGRWHSTRWPRIVVEALHRNVSLVVLVFLAIHITTTVVDGFVPIGWLDVVLPFRAGYRPVWIGLGALAVDCLLAIVVTSLLRVRIGHTTWRRVHWLAYASWPIALTHGLGAGTDTAARWMLALDGLAIVTVLVALAWRISVRRPAHPVGAPIALAAAAVVPMAIVLFAWTGPLQPHWSTGGARLGAARPAVTTTVAPQVGSASAGPGPAGPAATSPAASPVTLPLDLAVSGTRSVRDQDGNRIVSLVVHPTDGTAIGVGIDLVGAPDSSGGVQLRTGTVRVGPTGAAPQWQGAVRHLRGDAIEADLTGPGGARATFRAELAIDRGTGAVSGRVRVTATAAAAPADAGAERSEGDD